VDTDVAFVRWPQEEPARAKMALEGRPRLLLIASDVPAPHVEDPLEDWIRLPASDADLRARLETLSRRSGHGETTSPDLDDDGVLRHRNAWVSLPPVEARLTRALLERLGAVVSRDGLGRAGWPDGAPGRNALDVHVLRLRRRLEPVGLVIRTVRSRGYLLEASSPLAREA
jgi:DNA-binding response OmpR family regulator